jgi:hypothetical protein
LDAGRRKRKKKEEEKGSESEMKAVKKCVCWASKSPGCDTVTASSAPLSAALYPPLFLVPQRWYREVLHATAILQGAL